MDDYGAEWTSARLRLLARECNRAAHESGLVHDRPTSTQ
jgi:hypothetical protein